MHHIASYHVFRCFNDFRGTGITPHQRDWVHMKTLEPFVYSPSSHLQVSLFPFCTWHKLQWSADHRAHPSGSWHTSPRALFFPLFRVGIIHQLLFSSEVTLKGLRVMFLVFALSHRSCQYIYQSNHHGPDGGVWLPSHFSLLDNLLISFPGSTRFILIKLLSAVTPEMPWGHPGRASCSPLSPLIPLEAQPAVSPGAAKTQNILSFW